MSIHRTNHEPSDTRSLNDLCVAGVMEAALRSAGLDSLDALFAASGENLGKPGLDPWRQRIRLTLSVGGADKTFYLKRFTRPPPSARREVRRSGTGARSVAGMEWSWMRRLASDGIPCVEPVAFGEQLHGGREVRSAILARAVPGRSLESLCTEWGIDDRGAFGPLIVHLAELVARLHAGGYIHRDLYLSHVFHDPEAPPERSLRLIDLQRVIRPSVRHRRWIVKDLAALNHSVPARLIRTVDRVRWLKHYMQASKTGCSLRLLLYLIVGKTQRIDRHATRRRRRPAMSGAAA